MGPIRALDLFSGVGGFRAGAEMVNHKFNFVGHSEIDSYPLKGYTKMFDVTDEASLGDIKAITRSDNEVFSDGFLKPERARTIRIKKLVPDHDILFAGFPCQPFSEMGGKKGVHDALGRGNLIFDVVEVLRVKKPNWFVLENVKGFYTHNNGYLRKAICAHLGGRKLGYDVECWLLDAKNFDIPQTRNRVFIVGRKKGLGVSKITTPRGSPPVGYWSGTHSILEKEVDDKYYLSEKIKPTILSNGTGGWYAKSEINQFIARPLCKTMHKMHRASQDNYYSDSFINGHWDNEKEEIVEAETGRDCIRKITPREAFRIQSFQESLIDKLLTTDLSDTRLFMAAGNAVPPKLVEAVLKGLLGSGNDESIEQEIQSIPVSIPQG